MAQSERGWGVPLSYYIKSLVPQCEWLLFSSFSGRQSEVASSCLTNLVGVYGLASFGMAKQTPGRSEDTIAQGYGGKVSALSVTHGTGLALAVLSFGLVELAVALLEVSFISQLLPDHEAVDGSIGAEFPGPERSAELPGSAYVLVCPHGFAPFSSVSAPATTPLSIPMLSAGPC
jgi:hypothetical protein